VGKTQAFTAKNFQNENKGKLTEKKTPREQKRNEMIHDLPLFWLFLLH
jgi:hypothetical protein